MSKRLSLARGNARLRQLVGFVHAQVDAAHASPERQHAGVRCTEGCACAPAGCCGLLTLVEDVEAQYIVDRNPETVRRVLPALLEADRRISEIMTAGEVGDMFDDRVAGKYHRAGIVCPFLGADRRCSIYRDRPLACRTHFVLSEPVECTALEDNENHITLDKGTRITAQAHLMRGVARVRGRVMLGTLPQLVLRAWRERHGGRES